MIDEKKNTLEGGKSSVLKAVVSKNGNQSKNINKPNSLQNFLLLKETKEIIQDAFWWIIKREFQNHNNDLENILKDRIAKNCKK